MRYMASESAPLRELLEKQFAWHWDQEQETSFKKLKQMVSSTPVLGYYDPTKPVTFSNCVYSTEVPSVYLLKANCSGVRPQTIALHLKQALTSGTIKATENDVNPATV